MIFISVNCNCCHSKLSGHSIIFNPNYHSHGSTVWGGEACYLSQHVRDVEFSNPQGQYPKLSASPSFSAFPIMRLCRVFPDPSLCPTSRLSCWSGPYNAGQALSISDARPASRHMAPFQSLAPVSSPLNPRPQRRPPPDPVQESMQPQQITHQRLISETRQHSEMGQQHPQLIQPACHKTLLPIRRPNVWNHEHDGQDDTFDIPSFVWGRQRCGVSLAALLT